MYTIWWGTWGGYLGVLEGDDNYLRARLEPEGPGAGWKSL